MDLKKINETFSVAGQITSEDVAALLAMGFKGVICNRPDGEAADQTDYQTIKRAAQAAGLEIRYVPIQPGVMGTSEVAAFQTALDELPEPVLAYCRSGARSTAIYQASQAKLK